MRKKGLVVMFIVSSLLVGCSTAKSIEVGTTTTIGLPAHENNIYIQQEITAVLNQLTTRMATGRMLASNVNSENIKMEMFATDYSINVVKSCYDVIKNMYIEGLYKDEQELLLVLLEKTINEMTIYKIHIEENDTGKIRNSISSMEILFNSLTSVSNQLYK